MTLIKTTARKRTHPGSRPPRSIELAVDGLKKSSACLLTRRTSSGGLSVARNSCSPSMIGVQGPHPDSVEVRV
jgi:hypothetical protein